MSFINFIFENVVYTILFMSLLFVFGICGIYIYFCCWKNIRKNKSRGRHDKESDGWSRTSYTKCRKLIIMK